MDMGIHGISIAGNSAVSGSAPAIPTSGLRGWYKADSGLFQLSNGTTAATNTGDVVGYWADQSGNNNNITQATTANKPTLANSSINSLPVVFFPNVLKSWLSFAVAPPLGGSGVDFTVYMVGAVAGTSTHSSPGLMSGATGNDINLFNNSITEFVDAAINVANPTATLVTASNHAMRYRKSGSTYFFKTGGTETSATNATIGVITPTLIGFGSNTAAQGYDGTLGEVIIYNRALTGTEQTQVETYLSGRWGLTV